MKDIKLERQLEEMKKQLEAVILRLDTLVGLEIKHDNTVESVNRCHKRVDKLKDEVDKLAKEAAKNTFITTAAERGLWMIGAGVIGFIGYALR